MTITNTVSLPPNAPMLLLVEDNIIALKLIETIVTQAGCRYLSATDGQQALELAKTVPFELIITDLGLPGISGLELTHLLRDWERLNHKRQVPIIGLTADALSDSKSRCFQAGMNKVLSKPIYLHEIQALILQFVKQNRERHGRIFDRGLPDNEAELFTLKTLPLIDLEQGIKNMGDEAVLKKLLLLMIEQAIPEDKASIVDAYLQKDWQKIEDLAHKMKSGALYCGAIKMQYACQYLERYRKAGHSVLLEKLYQQLILVLIETEQFIANWLEKKQD